MVARQSPGGSAPAVKGPESQVAGLPDHQAFIHQDDKAKAKAIQAAAFDAISVAEDVCLETESVTSSCPSVEKRCRGARRSTRWKSNSRR